MPPPRVRAVFFFFPRNKSVARGADEIFQREESRVRFIVPPRVTVREYLDEHVGGGAARLILRCFSRRSAACAAEKERKREERERERE